MIERTRPERPPYIPRWLLPTVLVVLGLLVVAGAIVGVRSVQNRVEVPIVVGLTESVATVRLAQAGLETSVVERPFDASPAGTVLEQSPAEGQIVARGDTIALVVSEGTEEFEMPDVVGSSVRVVRAQLEAKGVTIKIEEIESEAPSDTVLATNPSAGATLRTTDIVRLTVAKAPDASTALVPYALTGATLIIDPGPPVPGATDVTLEVARRLRSLLEASGAIVTVTRSAAGTTTASPGADAPAVTLAAFIGLDVTASGTGGMAVSTLSATQAGVLYSASYALGDSVETELRGAGNTVARETTNDAALAAANGPGLRVQFGSFASPSDSSAFADPAWADKIARALYRAIGERIGSR